MIRKYLPERHNSGCTRRNLLADAVRLAAITVVGGAYSRAGAEPEPAAMVRALDAFSIRGINYYPAQTPWGGLWTSTPVDVIERDMALMASFHVNAVRTFLPCPAGTQAAKLTDADGNASPAYVEKIERFLRAAWRRGIRTIFCFDFDDKTLAQADGALWRTLIRAVIGRYRADGRVLMWDLMNEPEGHQWSAASRAYLTSAMPYVKELDERHLTTVGIGWEIERLAELGLPDVLQYHEYAPKQELFEHGIERVGKTISRMRKIAGTVRCSSASSACPPPATRCMARAPRGSRACLPPQARKRTNPAFTASSSTRPNISASPG